MYKVGDFLMYYKEEVGALSSRQMFYFGRVKKVNKETNSYIIQTRNRDTSSNQVYIESEIPDHQISCVLFFAEMENE